MLATHLGFYNTASTRTHVRFQFSTHAAAGGNVAPLSAFEAADLRIYKAADGAAFSATQRSSASGITMTSPFDTLTGFHDVDIDLTDNTDASFYATGSLYSVVLAPDTETVDSQTITGIVLAYFEIGVRKADVTQWLGTAASTPTVAGVPNVNAKTWNDLTTVALPLVPTTAGRTLDVSAGGEAGVDWANVGSPTTAVDLSGTTIKTTQKVDVDTIKTNPVVNGGTITFPTTATLASTTNITAGTITTATTATNLTTNNDKTGYRLSSTGVDDVLRTALTESYAADGAAGTLSQILFALQAFLQERAVSGTTVTCKKLDGSTTAMTFTLNDGTTPTSITRAS